MIHASNWNETGTLCGAKYAAAGDEDGAGFFDEDGEGAVNCPLCLSLCMQARSKTAKARAPAVAGVFSGLAVAPRVPVKKRL